MSGNHTPLTSRRRLTNECSRNIPLWIFFFGRVQIVFQLGHIKGVGAKKTKAGFEAVGMTEETGPLKAILGELKVIRKATNDYEDAIKTC